MLGLCELRILNALIRREIDRVSLLPPDQSMTGGGGYGVSVAEYVRELAKLADKLYFG